MKRDGGNMVDFDRKVSTQKIKRTKSNSELVPTGCRRISTFACLKIRVKLII